MIVGTEWLVEAEGCDPESLRDEALLKNTFARIISDLGLKAIDSVWHKFPGEGGVTGMVALTESHLACHTYPEHRIATFNLYCCRTRPEWAWEANLKAAFSAKSIRVTKMERGSRRSYISDSKFETEASQFSNSKLETQSSQISNLRSEIEDPQYAIGNPRSTIRNPKSQAAGGDH